MEYVGINNVAKPIKNEYVGVNGVAKRVLNKYVGDGSGVAKLCWSASSSDGFTFFSRNTSNISNMNKTNIIKMTNSGNVREHTNATQQDTAYLYPQCYQDGKYWCLRIDGTRSIYSKWEYREYYKLYYTESLINQNWILYRTISTGLIYEDSKSAMAFSGDIYYTSSYTSTNAPYYLRNPLNCIGYNNKIYFLRINEDGYNEHADLTLVTVDLFNPSERNITYKTIRQIPLDNPQLSDNHIRICDWNYNPSSNIVAVTYYNQSKGEYLFLYNINSNSISTIYLGTMDTYQYTPSTPLSFINIGDKTYYTAYGKYSSSYSQFFIDFYNGSGRIVSNRYTVDMNNFLSRFICADNINNRIIGLDQKYIYEVSASGSVINKRELPFNAVSDIISDYRYHAQIIGDNFVAIGLGMSYNSSTREYKLVVNMIEIAMKNLFNTSVNFKEVDLSQYFDNETNSSYVQWKMFIAQENLDVLRFNNGDNYYTGWGNNNYWDGRYT